MVYPIERTTLPKSETLLLFCHYDSCIKSVASAWNCHLLLLCLSDWCDLILSAVPNLSDRTNSFRGHQQLLSKIQAPIVNGFYEV